MSDTPRTDANYVCHYGDGLGQWVPREFACDLERELAAAQAERNAARNDALEEAATLCETHQDDRNRHDHTKDAYIATLQCAAAIRALKDAE